MGNVGTGNNVTGTITAVNQLNDPNCNPSPPPYPPGCYNTWVAYDVSNTGLELGRFENGRIKIGLKTFNVWTNLANKIYLKGVPSGSTKSVVGQTFTVYDDDDYNADDTLLDGDENEQVLRLPESFRHVAAEDGVYADGKLKNLYSSAYIMPEYDWAQNAGYNQTSLPFTLNVAWGTNGTNLDTVINANRNTITNSESSAFWIAYVLIAYQGDITEDGDGVMANPPYDPQPGVEGVGRSPTGGVCDCFQSATCIGTSCNSVSPTGAFGSLIFQEVMQDVTKTWLINLNLVIDSKGIIAPHEIGHQFGLRGDNVDPANPALKRSVATYGLMDYPHRPSETDAYYFHPEHINIMRKRVTSPGE